MRYDIFTRHTEENNLATTFILGPGSNIAPQVAKRNYSLGLTPPVLQLQSATTIAMQSSRVWRGFAVHGYAASKSLGKGDHNGTSVRA